MTTLPPVKESAILYSCIQWLAAHGCDVVRCNTGGAKKSYTSKKTGKTKTHFIRFGKKGMGDIIAINPRGRWIEVETKRVGNEQRKEQLAREAVVKSKNGVYILAYSSDDLEARKQEILA